MDSSINLREVIDRVSQEKGIEPKVLVEATEQAILTAAKRTFGVNRELEARFNPESGWVDLFQYMEVVDEVDDEEREISAADAEAYKLEAEVGDELGFKIFYRPEDAAEAAEQDKKFGDLLKLKQARGGFGRIAAQTAKQVIIQRLRDAEREKVYNEYKDRVGEVITGVVRRFERHSNIIVDLGNGVEAVLPNREQTPRESYRPGDRILAYLKRIDREARGPQIVLSRGDTGLLVKLFEMEVPEIYEGIVRIVSASREPGARSKIAVASRDSDVDPVGACVGMKGSRVQAVVQELRGEKIDIVPWDRDPARFVCNAIAPAEVVRVVIDEGRKAMELVVPDAKLSLAIGRRGQNVRLASQLTGWRLDIVSEKRFKEMEEEALSALARIQGLGDDGARALYKMGFRSLDEVAEAPDEELAAIVGDEHVAAVRGGANQARELYRQERVREALAATELLSERDKLQLIRGVSEGVAETLEKAGLGNIDAIIAEGDVDRFTLRSGLGAQRGQVVWDSANTFVKDEWPQIAAAQEKVRVAKAEAARVAAEQERLDAEKTNDDGANSEASQEAKV